jgi:hypothetical protein
MKLLLTRNSVCMGDDVESHDARYDTDAETLEEIIQWIHNSRYLPTIGGGCATWSAVSNLPLAVFAQQWSSPKLLLLNPSWYLKKLQYEGEFLKVHLNYHAQIDPNVVVEVLKRYRNE